MAKATSQVTFRAPDVWLGEFRLPAGHPRWNRVTAIGEEWPLIAFPGPAVEIHQLGHQPVVADRLRAVTYSAGQAYRRRLIAPEGDRCAYVSFSRRLAAEAALGFDPAAVDLDRYRFPFPAVAIGEGDFVLKQRVRSRVLDVDTDPGEIRERLYWLIGRAVASGYGDLRRPRRRMRRATAHEHAELSEAVRRIVGRDPSARLTLDEMAAELHVSPFHLSRVFRAQTGQSIHGHRTALRLRASLERIADGLPLADVALDLGFASQTHLAESFRRRYGVTPGSWRRAIHGVQMSTIVEEIPRSVA